MDVKEALERATKDYFNEVDRLLKEGDGQALSAISAQMKIVKNRAWQYSVNAEARLQELRLQDFMQRMRKENAVFGNVAGACNEWDRIEEAYLAINSTPNLNRVKAIRLGYNTGMYRVDSEWSNDQILLGQARCIYILEKTEKG